ncbi:peptidase T [Craterilacuibacter sp.]|uniref:peptidase T n=1 Tax=Craterilacuibacter sp. TaxID=2870909 RepID=UPI003F41A97C
MQSPLVQRFLRYARIDSHSDPASPSVPSTLGQRTLASELADELRALGLSDVVLDANGYLTARLPATLGCSAPAIGWIAHLDTSPDFPSQPLHPQFITAWNGKEIALSDSGEKISLKAFPALRACRGHDLITTDGYTLLGADDKAGIAEIVTAIETLLAAPDIVHGDIWLAFTPDEEIGRGADHFPMERFPAKWAYTVDGGELGELEYENFNAASATIRIRGNNVHPGMAYGSMVNALTLASVFHAGMPRTETPEHSLGYEGFFHLHKMSGNTEAAELHYLVRDFIDEGFARRKVFLAERIAAFNNELDTARLTLEICDSYYNMRRKIEPHPHILDIARAAMQDAGVKPKVKPIRGGTDGSRLSFMGLPCPNLFTGGYNFHGKHECVSIQAMHKAVEVLIAIARRTAQHPDTEPHD